MSYLSEFYGIMGKCGMDRPPLEAWLAHARENAELWPIVKQGKLVGGIFFKGHIIHIAVLPEWHKRWITKEMLRAYRTWTHDCEIVAHPPQDNKAARALLEALGFKYRTTQREFAIYVKEPNPCHPQ